MAARDSLTAYWPPAVSEATGVTSTIIDDSSIAMGLRAPASIVAAASACHSSAKAGVRN
ncbi:hypothetical protein [Agromyces albus]|uniref:hypothetical protein n=1 Tax=Agromyces albus TaxID=205332 RepID=UPI0027D893B4|nr:hypothetical protein [Agromyces albus]